MTHILAYYLGYYVIVLGVRGCLTKTFNGQSRMSRCVPFNISLKARLHPVVPSPRDFEVMWARPTPYLPKTSQLLRGPPWITDETVNAIQLKIDERMVEDMDEWRQLNSVMHFRTSDCQHCYHRPADDAEAGIQSD